MRGMPSEGSRVAAIVGAAQNTVSQPTYSGCRTTRYAQGEANPGGVYGTRRNANHTWRTPNRSKWLTRHVAANTVTQPAANWPYTATRAAPPGTSQTTPPSGRHCQNSRIRAAFDSST